jgi:ATP-dependent phosphoenolpyruvate carboxykinase
MLHPEVYADLFYERLKNNNVKVWLLNTGYLFTNLDGLEEGMVLGKE